MKLAVRPLTPDLWRALEDLFAKNGACNGCWCMYWRIGSGYRERPAEQNNPEFREVVKRGPPPGLLAFDGDVAVGWYQLTPRDALPCLDRAWRRLPFPFREQIKDLKAKDHFVVLCCSASLERIER